MPNYSERFQLLSREFESLVQRLNDSPNLDERTKLLRRMKVLIVELEMLISSSLKRDTQDIPILSPPDQPIAES